MISIVFMETTISTIGINDGECKWIQQCQTTGANSKSNGFDQLPNPDSSTAWFENNLFRFFREMVKKPANSTGIDCYQHCVDQLKENIKLNDDRFRSCWHTGNYLALEHGKSQKNGDIVAALSGNSPGMKKLANSKKQKMKLGPKRLIICQLERRWNWKINSTWEYCNPLKKTLEGFVSFDTITHIVFAGIGSVLKVMKVPDTISATLAGSKKNTEMAHVCLSVG